MALNLNQSCIKSTLADLVRNGSVWLAEGNSKNEISTLQEIFETKAIAPNTTHDSIIRQCVPFNISQIDQSLPHRGLLKGALHEWFPFPVQPDKLSSKKDWQFSFPWLNYSPCTLLALLAGNAIKKPALRLAHDIPAATNNKFIVWIGRSFWPAPYVFEQLFSTQEKSILAYNLFLNPPSPQLHLWCLELALRSNAVAAVVAEFKGQRLADSQRLALAAKNSGALGLLIRNQRELAVNSAATTRWKIHPTPSPTRFPRWQLELIKHKGAHPQRSSWIVQFNYEDSDENFSVHLPDKLVNQRTTTPALQAVAR